MSNSIQEINLSDSSALVQEQKLKTPSFMSSAKYEKMPEDDVFVAKTKKKQGLMTSLVLMTATGLAIASDYIFAKGKHVKSIYESIRNLFKKEKCINLEEFKKQGNKFVKGEALTSTGDKYTGTIEQILNDGTKYKLKYTEGELVESYKNDKLFKKYAWNMPIKNGKNNVVQIYNPQNETTEFVDIALNNNGKVFNINKSKGKYVYDFKAKKLNEIKGSDIIENRTMIVTDAKGKLYSKNMMIENDNIANAKHSLNGHEMSEKNIDAILNNGGAIERTQLQLRKQVNNTLKKAVNKAPKEQVETKAESEVKKKINKEAEKYLQAEEDSILEYKKASDARNEKWLKEQRKIKEQEYSEIWEKGLAKKEAEAKAMAKIKLEKEFNNIKQNLPELNKEYTNLGMNIDAYISEGTIKINVKVDETAITNKMLLPRKKVKMGIYDYYYKPIDDINEAINKAAKNNPLKNIEGEYSLSEFKKIINNDVLNRDFDQWNLNLTQEINKIVERYDVPEFSQVLESIKSNTLLNKGTDFPGAGIEGIASFISKNNRISQTAIADYAKANGFTKVNYTVTFADKTSAHVIYEGSNYAITSDGRLLKMVISGSNKTPQDVTGELVKKAEQELKDKFTDFKPKFYVSTNTENFNKKSLKPA